MLLLLLTVLVAFGGIVAIEFGQASRPLDPLPWSDDVERRLLRIAADRAGRR